MYVQNDFSLIYFAYWAILENLANFCSFLLDRPSNISYTELSLKKTAKDFTYINRDLDGVYMWPVTRHKSCFLDTLSDARCTIYIWLYITTIYIIMYCNEITWHFPKFCCSYTGCSSCRQGINVWASVKRSNILSYWWAKTLFQRRLSVGSFSNAKRCKLLTGLTVFPYIKKSMYYMTMLQEFMGSVRLWAQGL